MYPDTFLMTRNRTVNNMDKNKKIYVVVTQTGTLLSRILKRVTHKQYNHASISLTETLDTLYSFGRKNPYNAFIGGFVQESPTRGTFGRFKNTDAIVLEKEVHPLVYDEIKLELDRLYENRSDYKYNYFGLFAGFFGKNIHMKKRYYCSEFVQYILRKHNIGLPLSPNDMVCPNDFVNLEDTKVIYVGKLRAYKAKNKKTKKKKTSKKSAAS